MNGREAEDAREAEVAARRRALDEQIAARPVEEVVGVVDFGGRGGWPAGGELMTLCLSLCHWRTGSGPLRSQRLTTRFTTSSEDYASLMSRIKVLDVVRLRARVVEDSAIGTPQAEVVEFLGHDDDPELARMAVDRKIPVVHEDPYFGELVLERAYDWFKGDVKWRRSTVDLMAVTDESGSPAAAFATARSLWDQPEAWTRRVEEFAVQELLPVKNENWLDEDEGEAPLTPQQFLRRMKLESIIANPDGSFEFWFDDGDLFLGHSIQVRGTLSEGPTDADIPG